MKSLFLQLIQPVPFTCPVEITENDLYEIKEQGMRHNLFQLIYSQLQKYQKFIFPQTLVKDFLKESSVLYLKGITLSMRQEASENEIISLLWDRGIPLVVIRGNEIAREIYDDPNARTSSDIDILIKISDALCADSILTKAGYPRNDGIPLKFWFYRIHHAVYSCPKTENLIEIHWNFGIPSFFKLSSEEIWEGVIPTDSGQFKLSPEMSMIMLLIHNHMHSFRELRILVDILWALYKYENIIDWDTFVMKIRKIGLVKTTQITLDQIQMLWKETAEEIPSIRVLQNELEKMRYKEPKVLISFFKMNIDKHYSFQDYKDKLVARFALDKWSTTLLSYFKTLFPVPEAIKELYKDRRNWFLPFNYLKFIKWRVGDWTGGVQKKP